MKKISITLTFLGLFLIGNLDVSAQSKYTEDKSINSLLKKKREYNKYNGTGFRIQLYNGSEGRARNIKNNFESEFSGVYTKLDYDAPDWKVQVGSYKTRLDADRALNKIREKFSGAIIISK
ncbi:sporulation related protein [Tenacibaculum adriaticum]|uniref:Sporulation related protein n=1 Tax=Tenacibaculum adriaticum TaxID=413713 RepID=A0A5S5DZX4_9FLAO|nr:SPOR domain-containing protein [Tenacibaculum adriaticum]TYQ00303.1 sporulation related protein [Tenacibaculum adriaticum]